jgi:hypothetical protein
MDPILFKAANMEIHSGLMGECGAHTDTIKWDEVFLENELFSKLGDLFHINKADYSR